MAYSSETASLAVLETVVHLNTVKATGYYLIRCTIPEEVPVSHVSRTLLAADWKFRFEETQAIGQAWIDSRSTVALIVPSAVLDVESNVLINPSHQDFSKLTFDRPQRLSFDPRLLSRSD
ncbi:hypothetical protein AYO38_03930 [bacterium SCGC AG-212-C10]|nr:hypothetical protein AYO38_03930 [bacterium SCGC AG-212-C10]